MFYLEHTGNYTFTPFSTILVFPFPQDLEFILFHRPDGGYFSQPPRLKHFGLNVQKHFLFSLIALFYNIKSKKRTRLYFLPTISHLFSETLYAELRAA